MMENYGGVSAYPDKIVRIIEAVDSEYCRVLTGFLNWTPKDDKMENLSKVAPYDPCEIPQLR